MGFGLPQQPQALKTLNQFRVLGVVTFRNPGFMGRVARILAAVLQTQTAKDIKSAAAAPPAFRSFLLADYIM